MFDVLLLYLITVKIYIGETITDLARELAGSTSDLISTIVGNGGSSFSGDNGQATAASLGYPYGMALDSSGTTTYLKLLGLF